MLALYSLMYCIPQNLRNKLDDAGYSGHNFLLKVACGLGLQVMHCANIKIPRN